MTPVVDADLELTKAIVATSIARSQPETHWEPGREEEVKERVDRAGTERDITPLEEARRRAGDQDAPDEGFRAHHHSEQ